jgi:hypothetical protein
VLQASLVAPRTRTNPLKQAILSIVWEQQPGFRRERQKEWEQTRERGVGRPPGRPE